MDEGKDGLRCLDTIDDAFGGGDTSGWIFNKVGLVVIKKCYYKYLQIAVSLQG